MFVRVGFQNIESPPAHVRHQRVNDDEVVAIVAGSLLLFF